MYEMLGLTIANCRQLHKQRLAIARLLFQVRFNDVHFAILDEVRMLNSINSCILPRTHCWSRNSEQQSGTCTANLSRFDSG